MSNFLDESSCHYISAEALKNARDTLPSNEEIVLLSGFFKAMGDPSRIRIMWALAEQEMCGCDLAELLGITKSAVSHQLKHLRAVNLVDFRKEGRRSIYFLADHHVQIVFNNASEHIHESSCESEGLL